MRALLARSKRKEYNRGLCMIEINNLTESKIDEEFLRRVAERVLTGEKKRRKGLSIALVTPKHSAELNKRYRGKSKIANILSFEGEGSELGEVIICPQEVRKDAAKYGMMFERALAWMLIHGILHLAGYNHKKERDAKIMGQKELTYLSRI
ncbi:MAG: rRNA maturation RNase YbeY [Candidatus Wildermuthbacteria bacterium RIFCSPHIGHO2_02_FULL_49_17]|nr:MAG: rRNA maturation RNase YbeY [Candidatus Wildermuthbacteria bacterium RIFCSPHIGHO2_02_FULL_49_17]